MSEIDAMLILASASPRRKELLKHLGLVFQVKAADIDETPQLHEHPLAMTARLARAKAQTVANQLDGAFWVLGSDTTVALGNRIFGKPASRQQAIDTLSLLADRRHEVISSVCLLGEGKVFAKNIISRVTFGKLSRHEIESYCDTDEPYDKAGGYGIQGMGGSFVEHIDGDYSAIIGLPLRATAQLLHRAKLLGDQDLANSKENGISRKF